MGVPLTCRCGRVANWLLQEVKANDEETGRFLLSCEACLASKITQANENGWEPRISRVTR